MDIPKNYINLWLANYESTHTIDSYRRCLQRILPYFPEDKTVETLTSIDLETAIMQWAKSCKPRPANTTFNATVVAWNSFYTFLFESKRVPEKVKCKKVRQIDGMPTREVPTLAEAKAIWKTLYAIDLDMFDHNTQRRIYEDRLLFALMFFAGLRCRELRGLKVQDIDRKRMQVHLPETITKGNKARTVQLPLGNELLEKILDNVIGNRVGTSPVFMPLNGDVRHVTSKTIVERVKNVLEASDVKTSYGPHDFRSYYTIQALEKGIPMSVVASQLGHTNINTTNRYHQLRNRQVVCGDPDLLNTVNGGNNEDNKKIA